MPAVPQAPSSTSPALAPGALDVLEEAVHLLRRAPAGTLAWYYGATLPFVLGGLFFWADLSHDPDAETLAKIHHLSHEECFIANSVTTEIIVA